VRRHASEHGPVAGAVRSFCLAAGVPLLRNGRRTTALVRWDSAPRKVWCPQFAFAFRSGLGQSLHDLAEADVAAGNADFVWVHLDLSEAAAQAWLRRRPWPPDVVEMVAAPIQRGRLFIAPDMVYGICATSATSPMPSHCKRARFALSPPGRCWSPVYASRYAQSRRCDAGSKRGRSCLRARLG
jgi:hypothetical protein